MSSVASKPCMSNGLGNYQFSHPSRRARGSASETEHFGSLKEPMASARGLTRIAEYPKKGETLNSPPIAHFPEFSRRAEFSKFDFFFALGRSRGRTAAQAQPEEQRPLFEKPHSGAFSTSSTLLKGCARPVEGVFASQSAPA